MATTVWDAGFLETSRGRIVERLRREPQTVEGLARGLALTPNAIRSHLAVLERDGVVEVTGHQRGIRKPAQLYALTAAGEVRLSRAYAPVLRGILDELATRLSPDQLDDVLRGAGRRLATRRAAATASTAARVAAAEALLSELGASTEAGTEDGHTVVRGVACPLADVTRKHEAVCRGLASLLGDVTGLPVNEACDRSGRPRCRFVIGNGAEVTEG